MNKVNYSKQKMPKKSLKTEIVEEVKHDASDGKNLLIKIVLTKQLSGLYLWICTIVLAATTYLWAALGAQLHNNNADQIINGYLFRNPDTLSQAYLPSAHTFLIKWPLYYLINIFGNKPGTYTFLTILSVLLTVAGLAFILSRIEKRPVVLGTLFLLLASVLLLIPSVPHQGNLIPVNMAMLATRNLEYIFYILGLWLFIRYRNFRQWQFWVGVLDLGLLIASDKLFLSISVVAALASLLIYSLSSGWNLVSVSAKWLSGTVLAGLTGFLLLGIINTLKIAHIVSGSALGPYSLIHSVHSALIAIGYAGLALATNLGANPADATTLLKEVPHKFADGLMSLAGLSYLINILFLLFGLVCFAVLLIRSLRHNKNAEVLLDDSSKLSIALIWSAISAVALFVATNHYYAADARYLTVSLFAAFISVAAVISKKQLNQWQVLLAGIIISFGILLSVPGVIHTYNQNQDAFFESNQRNSSVLEAVNRHRVDVLVGDYWRTVPLKFNAHRPLRILPLASCTDPRASLSLSGWNVDLKKYSFAYLLTLDGSQTDFPHCSLEQITSVYGRPNSSVVLAGSFQSPKEIMLFYDHGAHKSAPITKQPAAGPATVVPITLDELPYKVCTVPTIVNIVAHEDDDLLFMSPDLLHDIQAGHCVRSVYLTAGDAGGGMFYWLGREQGTEAAYSKILGTDDIWVDRVVAVGKDKFVTIANPRGNSKISLVFMYLPDGNLKGQGFASTHFQSLAKLDANQIPTIDSVYTGSKYTSAELTQVLTDLLHLYIPTEIRTQSNMSGGMYPDHSDHMAVGRFVQRAYQTYEDTQYEGRLTIPITYYLGYPGHQSPPNVGGADLTLKEDAFLEYSRHDGGVCHSIEICRRDPAYGAYLTRQYHSSY